MAEPDTALVLSAFRDFSQASASLEAAYQQLSKRVRSLSLELEETNCRLTRSVDDKERIGRHLRDVLESLSCGVLVSGPDGVLTHSNRAAHTMLARGQTQALPSSVDGLTEWQPELEAVFDSDGPTTFESVVRTEDPSVEASLHVERHDLVGERTANRGAVFVIRDVTELRALERQAQQMERLAAMGEMALELAHEVRNPLGSIRLYASLLAKDLEHMPTPARQAVSQIEVGIRSLENVVSNMLSFGRQQSPQRFLTEIPELLDEVSRFLSPLTEQRGVEVSIQVADGTEPIWADPDQLRQVLFNLWLNALNAMPHGGRILIEVSRGDDGLRLSFSDSGPGLTPAVLERVFDPFFSTDQKGTGLGLAVVSSIIEQHAGSIQASSEPDRGATFRIILPTPSEAKCAVKS